MRDRQKSISRERADSYVKHRKKTLQQTHVNLALVNGERSSTISLQPAQLRVDHAQAPQPALNSAEPSSIVEAAPQVVPHLQLHDSSMETNQGAHKVYSVFSFNWRAFESNFLSFSRPADNDRPDEKVFIPVTLSVRAVALDGNNNATAQNLAPVTALQMSQYDPSKCTARTCMTGVKRSKRRKARGK